MSKADKRRVGRVAMGIAAVGVATSIAGVAATQPASLSASLVDLTALIVVGSSTHPTGAGNEDFFQGKFNASPYFFGNDPKGKPDKLPVTRNVYGGTVGGPIQRNRLFFFGSFEG